uniref:Uncharacterized protein n=1 Tax=Arundo donax TaxID=35708 RepID=A0A0A9C7E7_ARUDO
MSESYAFYETSLWAIINHFTTVQ